MVGWIKKWTYEKNRWMVEWIENNYEKNKETKQKDGRMDKTNIWKDRNKWMKKQMDTKNIYGYKKWTIGWITNGWLDGQKNWMAEWIEKQLNGWLEG